MREVLKITRLHYSICTHSITFTCCCFRAQRLCVLRPCSMSCQRLHLNLSLDRTAFQTLWFDEEKWKKCLTNETIRGHPESPFWRIKIHVRRRRDRYWGGRSKGENGDRNGLACYVAEENHSVKLNVYINHGNMNINDFVVSLIVISCGLLMNQWKTLNNAFTSLVNVTAITRKYSSGWCPVFWFTPNQTQL